MKVKVLKEFIDKKTGKIHKEDEMFECSEKRFEEIMKVNKNLISVLNDEEAKGNEQEQETEIDENTSSGGSLCDIAQTEKHGEGCLDENDLESMNYSNIKKLAKDMGILTKGTKEELIKRITAEQIKFNDSENL